MTEPIFILHTGRDSVRIERLPLDVGIAVIRRFLEKENLKAQAKDRVLVIEIRTTQVLEAEAEAEMHFFLKGRYTDREAYNLKE